MFRYSINNLKHDGHDVVAVIRPKDVLEQLCVNAGLPVIKVKDRPKKWGLLGLGFSLIGKTMEVARLVRKDKPDILIGSDGVLAIVGRLIHRPAFECYEDDAEAIALYARMFFPLYTGLILNVLISQRMSLQLLFRPFILCCIYLPILSFPDISRFVFPLEFL